VIVPGSPSRGLVGSGASASGTSAVQWYGNWA